MNKITVLRFSGGRTKRIDVHLDGKFAFRLEAEAVLTAGLKVGQELAAERLEEVARVNSLQRGLSAARRYLSYRPRSEHELKERLKRRKFDADTIARVLDRLKDQGLVDDLEFARFWQDNRQTFSPRSGSLTRLELKRKGVAEAIIGEVVGAASDGESAYRAAHSKACRLPLSDHQEFRRRLGAYLKRRGFSYGVISNTVEQLWQERRESTP